MKILSISRADELDIANSIIAELRHRGHDVLKADYAKTSQDPAFFSMRQPLLEDVFNKIVIRITGEDGFHSKRTTRKLVDKIKTYRPDAVIIHWIHQNYINFRPVLSYCNNHDIAVILVANDTWLFTGRCAYFEMNGCYKWKTGCGHCPFPREYPAQYLFDRTHRMWNIKKRLFVAKNVVIVSPSNWLLNYIHQSFLVGDQNVLIYNGTNLDSFFPRNRESMRANLGIGPKDIMLLGIARPWTERKGLKYFFALAGMLPSNYKIVLRGVSEKQKKCKNIIYIDRYLSSEELASLFSAADVFVNPTQDEVWGLVNIEALACGTPVVTFNSGGSPETIDGKTGISIPKGDVTALKDAIMAFARKKPSLEDCVSRAQIFSLGKMANQYADIIEKKVASLRQEK
jgi:putative colanic acid biosynthesis glycosyltransferase